MVDYPYGPRRDVEAAIMSAGFRDPLRHCPITETHLQDILALHVFERDMNEQVGIKRKIPIVEPLERRRRIVCDPERLREGGAAKRVPEYRILAIYLSLLH